MGLTIGLTGGIASGKSTVSNMFREAGIPVVDADIVAREVVEPGEAALEQIAAVFGDTILLQDGNLNRKKLGEIIFAEKQKREQLNAIVHPVVRERMEAKRDQLLQKHQAVVLDIPLLFEGDQLHLIDRTVVVSVSESVQLERLMARNQLSEAEAKSRINAQLPLPEKVKRADAVIDNDGSLADTKQQFNQLLEEWNITAAK